ncbi:hypothetical protein JK359_15315 [Streptomyces actinomycinicus]|uniref:Uncharacterized protein n=1 Tax=Streptomyces actinomycinicus TaxID=1695166 RepID=A0A937EJD2_9ACTN|nr:hypothetical protein [Streptomyces actinomycinicus]MBL1083340.1 hypothetical protein [Streptomyces actinomycinicus]
MHDEQCVLDLLRALDRLPGPEHLEFPDGFDHAAAGARAVRLQERLGRDFGQPCSLDAVQDASCYFRVSIPRQATEADVHIAVRLSNYGDLAAVTTPRPDSHEDLDQAVAEGALSGRDRRRVEDALSDLGYVLVPLRLLHRLYDGVTWLADDVPGAVVAGYPPHQGRATWWTRFFEYL